MEIDQAIIGQKVKSNRDFSGVPKGTDGLIVEDYNTGIKIAWDLPDKPIPKNKTPQEIAKMWAIQPECPLRDWFDKQTELQYLDLL